MFLCQNSPGLFFGPLGFFAFGICFARIGLGQVFVANPWAGSLWSVGSHSCLWVVVARESRPGFQDPLSHTFDVPGFCGFGFSAFCWNLGCRGIIHRSLVWGFLLSGFARPKRGFCRSEEAFSRFGKYFFLAVWNMVSVKLLLPQMSLCQNWHSWLGFC